MKKNIIKKSEDNFFLFNKHAKINSSPIYLCYLILSENVKAPNRLEEDRLIPIYSLFNQIKRIAPQVPSKQIYFAIILMYSLKLIEFDRPYVLIKKNDKN